MWDRFSTAELILIQNSLSLSVMRGQEYPDSYAGQHLQIYVQMFQDIQSVLDSRGL